MIILDLPAMLSICMLESWTALVLVFHCNKACSSSHLPVFAVSLFIVLLLLYSHCKEVLLTTATWTLDYYYY
jgi:hypothetical protein